MRRIAMMAVLGGVVLAGLGCRHVAGKCDCGAHPGDTVVQAPTPPYAVAPAPGVTAAPAVTATPGTAVPAKPPANLPLQMPK